MLLGSISLFSLGISLYLYSNIIIKKIAIEENVKFNGYNPIDTLAYILLLTLLSISFYYMGTSDSFNFESFFTIISILLLTSIAFIDIKTLFVPDNLSIGALISSLISYDITSKILDSLAVLFFLYVLVKILGWLLKKDAMGDGDFLIAATMASILGFGPFFIAILLSGVSSSLYILITRREIIPFVPFLVGSTIVCYFFNEQVSHIIELIQTGRLI